MIYSKYKKISSTIFLSGYFAFLLISTIHFHPYIFNPEKCFNPQNQKNSVLVLDFLAGTSVCAVNHFSQTILDLDFSSSEVFEALPKLEEKIQDNYLSAVTSSLFHLISPRAPPAFS